MSVRVAAIDDHDVALLGLEQLIARTSTCELVATYSTVTDLLEAVPRAEVVLLDLRLKDFSDPYFNVQQLRAAGYNVLVYSSLESPFYLRRALQAGVNGVLDKSASPEVIANACHDVAQGGSYGSAEWAGLIDADGGFVDVHLSERQREVLELYAMGESARRVADLTGLSPETVQDYLTRIRTKYAIAGRNAATKVDLYRRAQEDGYLPGPLEG